MLSIRAQRGVTVWQAGQSRTSATQRPALSFFDPSKLRRRVAQLIREDLGSRRTLLGRVLGGVLGIQAAANAASPQQWRKDKIEKVFSRVEWPEVAPYKPDDFQRFDESSDAAFYASPRFVTHIDDAAIGALTQYYAENFPASGSGAALLDLCSSWISHYPPGYTAGRISGLGMNKQELARNPILSDYVVKDLNVDPSLPYEDNTFDVITNAVSVDYLVKPFEVFKEMHRVLKPGGLALMSFSNRCFPTKAIAMWTATGDEDHVWIVGSYFHYSVPGGFTPPEARDITPATPRGSDPMYVVFARKAAAEPKPADA